MGGSRAGDVSVDGPDSRAIGGEVRIRTEGGLAYFPGRARERVVCLDQIPAVDARAIERLADEAGFFDFAETANGEARPDARTHRLRLVIGIRSREVTLCEPIPDPALAKLVAAVRRL